MAKTKQKKIYILEQFAEDIELYLAEKECEVTLQDEESVNIYLDLPNTENYNYFINKIEKIFSKTKWDVEDWEIDGDMEGHIEILYIGE